MILVALGEDYCQLNHIASGNPLLLAAVASDSKPVLSFRGSTQAYSDGELGLWIRNMSGGTSETLKGNLSIFAEI